MHYVQHNKSGADIHPIAIILKLRKIPRYYAANKALCYACVHAHGGIRFWRLNVIRILFRPLKLQNVLNALIDTHSSVYQVTGSQGMKTPTVCDMADVACSRGVSQYSYFMRKIYEKGVSTMTSQPAMCPTEGLLLDTNWIQAG